MEKYLRQIETYQLHKAVKEWEEELDEEEKFACMGIECVINECTCPFYDVDACGSSVEAYTTFKEELNRREKMENKMPELKVGMIVDIRSYSGITRCVLLDTDHGLQPISQNWNWQARMENCEVLRIYKSEATNYELVFNGDAIELIWSKTSEENEKIEALEETIKKAQEQIAEIKKAKEKS